MLLPLIIRPLSVTAYLGPLSELLVALALGIAILFVHLHRPNPHTVDETSFALVLGGVQVLSIINYAFALVVSAVDGRVVLGAGVEFASEVLVVGWIASLLVVLYGTPCGVRYSFR